MSDRAKIREVIRKAPFTPEAEIVAGLIQKTSLTEPNRQAIAKAAAELITRLRSEPAAHLMESLLAEFELSTDEGVALMCLAEAFLRVPDAPTMDALIKDKIGGHDWSSHAGGSESLLVNASTWGLMLTGRIYEDDDEPESAVVRNLRHLVQRLGEPVLRVAVGNAMKIMAQQFVLGRTIGEAMERAEDQEDAGFQYSYDMLGEAARTEEDARRYFMAYSRAITEIAEKATSGEVHDNPGISVKLSALHPRYETPQRDRVLRQLAPRLSALMEMARNANIGLSVDAEEADRLDLSLDVVDAALANSDLAGWDGFGLVVQAYAKTALPVIDWLEATARTLDRRRALRLVKGAYWDYEIKNAQVAGQDAYPVFTRKQATDVSYLVCAERLLKAREFIFPQFATHNAHTVAAILHLAGDSSGYEFQRLHGMGEALHDMLMTDRREAGYDHRCRIYAPVGVHRDLLAYLVRRLLENGANSSFVNQLLDETVSEADLAADPFSYIEQVATVAHPKIPLPPDLFAPGRRNSAGINIFNPAHAARLDKMIAPFRSHRWTAAPLIGGKRISGDAQNCSNPANAGDKVGEAVWASADDAVQAIEAGEAAFPDWRDRSADARASVLDKCADLYEANAGELMGLLIREAGKTRLDAILELREAVDFLRYYAQLARGQFSGNTRRGRGVFVCISPWNFPLAIFTGQISAALVAGNSVIAKPAEQTSLIAMRAVELMHESGIPAGVLALLPGDGAEVGGALVSDPRIAGVCFTGSTETAIRIDRAMAETGNPAAPLVAETGGINAMIVDSTALPEHAVRDIVASAFQSAGQRCSALRVLFVQEEIADQLLDMLSGAADALQTGDPWQADTDAGPLIDEEAKQSIEAHCERLRASGRQLFRPQLPEALNGGHFIVPQAFRLDRYSDLDREVFGPVLHVVTFSGDNIENVIADINDGGYGLTFGVHSRLDDRVDWLCRHIRAGNIYVNRNQIGAVVGVQPFGGEGLSGTGPKAGGPLYLSQFSEVTDGAAGSKSKINDDSDYIINNLPDQIQMYCKNIIRRADQLMALAGDLPGPTGESNTLVLSGRGRVLCLGGGDDDLRSLSGQLLAALGTGNHAVMPDNDQGRRLKDLADEANFSERVSLATLSGDELDFARVRADLVVHDGGPDSIRWIRQALANRTGMRIPVVTVADGLERFLNERVISVDTTASGGNTTLLMLED